MNKAKLLFLLCLFIAIGVKAQRQNLYFLKNSGKYVKLRDSADYLRIVQEPDEGSELYKVYENYLDGSKKSIGFSSKIDPPLYEGQYIAYFKNGNKRTLAIYSKGKLIDTTYNYFPNGNLYTVSASSEDKDGKAIYYKTVKDSTGKELVTNGNGDCIFYNRDFKNIVEYGSIKNGYYNGVWNSGPIKNGSKYTDVYKDGKLISGESTDGKGKTYTYTKIYIQPQFKGGMNAFYTYLKKTIRYPQECFSRGIQGKVMLRFKVLKDGAISDIEVINSPHQALAKEAVRVVGDSPLWDPGEQRGQPVNVVFNVPVSFTLNR